MGNVVLVHGAWGVPEAWGLVAPELLARGHAVRCTALHRGTLEADVAAVQADVDALGGDAIVCGWSYGGAPITGLDPKTVRHLVYLCAFMPDEGETVIGLAQSAPEVPLGKAMQFGDDGMIRLEREPAKEAVFHDLPPEVAEMAIDTLVPQAMAPMTQPLPRITWRQVPSTYVLCERDRCVHPELQERLAARATNVVRLDCGHAPLLSEAKTVVDILDEAARG